MKIQNKISFEELYTREGKVFRNIKNRLTKRIKLDGKNVVIKLHNKMGLLEFLGTLIKFKIPVVGAKTEKQAIQKLQKIGIKVPNIIDYYESGILFWQKSYIILEDLGNIKSLEDLVLLEAQGNKIDAKLKKELIINVANIAKKLHTAGLVHRDFYLCHFILGKPYSDLTLIDLHRCAKTTNPNLIIKDLGGLLFSSENILTKIDKLRFIKHYSGCLRNINEKRQFWEKVENRANVLFSRVK